MSEIIYENFKQSLDCPQGKALKNSLPEIKFKFCTLSQTHVLA